MIATAAMWLACGRMHAAEAEHGQVFDEDETLPLYFTFGPFVLDAWAFWCIAQVVA